MAQDDLPLDVVEPGQFIKDFSHAHNRILRDLPRDGNGRRSAIYSPFSRGWNRR
jgi:hypothetical protein